MIDKQYITDNLQDIIPEDCFLVEVKVSTDQKVRVLVDSNEGIKLGECRTIHRALYPLLEAKSENFELEVSSPGLTGILKVWQQYKKIIGNELNITTKEGLNFNGILKNADDKKIIIEKTNKESVVLLYTEIRKAKQVIKF